MTGSHRRTALMATAAVTVGVLGGGAATYAATSVTDPGTNRPAGAGAVAVSAHMMDGRDTGMGSFDADAPFDAQFLDQMIMHHQGALMSTRAMIADSTRPELRDLADDIITSQSTQLDQMRTWRQQWYLDLAPTFAMGGSGGAMVSGSMMSGSGDEMMGASDGGMMSGSMMSGPATDRMYLQMMIAHHQLAVDMAEQAQAQAAHPDLVDLAATIAIEQAAEIDRMRGYLADLSAPSQD